ncbi:MAG: hypothetical protein WB680_15900 [Candidatus Acidiferrales bacterium]
MQVTQLWAQCLIGIAGGFACELLHWYSLSRKPGGTTRFSRHAVYWITTAGMIIVAGAMPLLYLQGTVSALLCFHLGAATPILLQKVVAAAPQLARGQGAQEDGLPTFRQFFGW